MFFVNKIIRSGGGVLTFAASNTLDTPIPERGGMNAFEVALVDKQYSTVMRYLINCGLTFLSEASHARFFELIKKLSAETNDQEQQKRLDFFKCFEKVELGVRAFSIRIRTISEPQLIIKIANYIVTATHENMETLSIDFIKDMDRNLIQTFEELMIFIKKNRQVEFMYPNFDESNSEPDSIDFFSIARNCWFNYGKYIASSVAKLRNQVFMAHKQSICNLCQWKILKRAGFLQLTACDGFDIYPEKKASNISYLKIQSIFIKYCRNPKDQHIAFSPGEHYFDEIQYDTKFIQPRKISSDSRITYLVYTNESLFYVTDIIGKQNKAIASILKLDWAVVHHDIINFNKNCEEIENFLKDLLFDRGQQKLLLSYFVQLKEILQEEYIQEIIDAMIQRLSTPSLRELTAHFCIKNNLFYKETLPADLERDIENSYFFKKIV